jgi:ADP-ribose pyrophosphatase YjhB (NUDIX family)
MRVFTDFTVAYLSLLYTVGMHKPTHSVRIVIFDQVSPDHFLVLTETDDPDNWKLPGGKFEMGKDGIESPADAAARELMEELGVVVEEVGLAAAATLTNDDGVSARYIFSGKAGITNVKPSAEIAKTQWFTEATLPDCKNKDHILSAVAAART